MIAVVFSKPAFEYDVHSLIKAFYPKEDVQMYYTCPEEEVGETNIACRHHGSSSETAQLIEEALHALEIDYREHEIEIVWKSWL